MSLTTTTHTASTSPTHPSTEPSTSKSGLQFDHLLGGLAGGFTSTLVVHPLDLLKIRFAVNEGRGIGADRPAYTGYVDAARSVIRQAGYRGLYQGVTPNLVGATAAWGLYFQAYNIIKETWRDLRADKSDAELTAYQHMASGMMAGCATMTITNPIWVVKTRLCLQYESHQRLYTGMLDALRKIYITEGIRGLYKGYIPGLLGTSHGAVQFAIYDELKYTYCRYKKISTRSKLVGLDMAEHFLFDTPYYLTFAAISKMAAATVTYPYQVIRARLQDQHANYRGLIDCVTRTYKNESVFGFYKGLGASLLRVTPATCITFVMYEWVVEYCRR